MIRNLLVIGCCALILVGCGESTPSEGPNQVIARVGDRDLTRAEIEARQALEATGGKGTLAFSVVTAGLISEAYEAELAEKLGVEPTEAEIAAVNEKVETHGSPEVVGKIKAIFKEDSAAYFRHMIIPQAVAARLRAHYTETAGNELDSRKKMHRALQLLEGESSFPTVASSLLLESRMDTFWLNAPPTEDMKLRYGQQVTSNPVLQLLEPLKSGEHLNQLLEDKIGYRIVRIIDRNDERIAVELIEGPKYSYQTWFHEQAGSIGLEVLDRKLRRGMKDSLQQIWWVEKLTE